ncbi:hypothetical protein [Streptomyces sp. bgisy159]|uniref:hypothetical protein n=1 Tax=Streptomyces sp. bgisy159 TaxID=3413795 RepID=UPI003F4A6087
MQSDAVPHLQATPVAYDVLYNVFGTVDFTDPRELVPAAARTPGGRLVFVTLTHYLSGAPAQLDAMAADNPAKTPDGGSATNGGAGYWACLNASAGLRGY